MATPLASLADTVNAYGVNDSGVIVGVDFAVDGTYTAFVYNPASSSYTFLIPPGATYSQAIGINDSGQIVGEAGNSSALSGFLLSGGIYSSIIPAGTLQYIPASINTGGGAAAAGINDDGEIVGSWTKNPSGNEYGFTYSGGTFTGTNVADAANYTVLYGINDSGIASGYAITFPNGVRTYKSFLYNTNTDAFTPIAFPGATSTITQGINDSGEAVGWYNLDGHQTGFIYEDGAYTSLAYPGASQTDLFGVSNNGEIVGGYTCTAAGCPLSDPAFYAIPTQIGYSFTTLPAPTPEPGSWALMESGFLAILGAAWRRRRGGFRPS